MSNAKFSSAVLKPSSGVAKEGECFRCTQPGHWKRNYKFYLVELAKQKKSKTSTLGIFVIEVNFSTSSSWVLDIGCGSHIYANVQDLSRTRRLA